MAIIFSKGNFKLSQREKKREQRIPRYRKQGTSKNFHRRREVNSRYTKIK
jgi:hypothetical protein